VPLLAVLRRFSGLFFCLLLLVESACARDKAALPTIPLQVGGQTLTVELAVTEAEQQRGLMYRYELASDHGMLFVYQEPREVAYWMKNTFIPLSIAYIGPDRRIFNILDMAPNNSSRTYPSNGRTQYVLEVNQGWFREHNVKVGDRVEFTLPGSVSVAQPSSP
jgi:uncharacterized membrane protein (UPF0127 family)